MSRRRKRSFTVRERTCSATPEFKREEALDAPVRWHNPSKRKALKETPQGKRIDWIEHIKASLQTKVEHPFHVVKNLFCHRRTRSRGLAKNIAQLFTLFSLANPMLAQKERFSADTRGAS
jgi:IS5 family transposase